MARRFMFVCFGILALALSYHVGALKAGAQTASAIEAAACYDVPGIVYDVKAAVINRRVYELGGNGPTLQYPDAIPGTARAIAVGLRGVILENGEIWTHDNGTWQLQGVFPVLGPTPAQTTTFGAIKAKFRR